MAKSISSRVFLSGNLTLTECTDGYWLYDKTRGMNLSMKAKTSEDAFVECISYYQTRLNEVENTLNSVQSRVDDFMNSFGHNEECS